MILRMEQYHTPMISIHEFMPCWGRQALCFRLLLCRNIHHGHTLNCSQSKTLNTNKQFSGETIRNHARVLLQFHATSALYCNSMSAFGMRTKPAWSIKGCYALPYTPAISKMKSMSKGICQLEVGWLQQCYCMHTKFEVASPFAPYQHSQRESWTQTTLSWRSQTKPTPEHKLGIFTFLIEVKWMNKQ